MATKTPGIYFEEYDNTQYTNPKTTTGTNVCVIGFARKGPIGKPVAINSYNKFLSIFGNSVDGFYSSLAVKNILSAGGGVIFVRVADETASPSNVVIKNGIKGTNGKVFFDRGTDILLGTKGYENKSIYSLVVEDYAGEAKKQILVRSPKVGKLSQSSVLEQIEKNLVSTPATYEAIHRGVTQEGVYSFEVEVDGEIKDNTLEGVIEPKDQGFYVEVKGDESTELLTEAVKNALYNGPNTTFNMWVTNPATKEQEGEKYFNVKDPLSKLTGNYAFILKTGNLSIPITIDGIVGERTNLEDLVKLIDKKVKQFKVRCILYPGKEGEEKKAPRIIFFNTSGKTDKLEIASLTESKGNNHNLFYSDTELAGFTLDSDLESKVGFYIHEATPRSSEGKERTTVSVEMNKDTDSIVFTGTEKGNEKTVKIVPAPYGNFLFDNDLGCKFIKNENDIVTLKGQNGIENKVFISRDVDSRKIYFESENNIETPVLKTIEEGKLNCSTGGILELLNIEKNPSDPLSKGFTQVKGELEVSPDLKDMVIVTSKEFGSDTNNITIEFHTTTSPINESIKQHDVYISVDGELRETYEDVSYDLSKENNFKNLINRTEDNGGSKFVEIKIKKNETDTDIIGIRDGIYKVGKPNNPDDRKRTTSVEEDEYKDYEYSVGTDGISEDNGLFMKAMDKEESPLADEQLYNFHILIHPDNISEDAQNAAIALCEERKDSFTIVDPPVGISKNAVIDWHNGKGGYGRTTPLDTNYAAAYWPWCKVYDNNTKQQIWVMPSAIMAAQYVRVDKNVGSWYAPAGEANGILPIMDIQEYPNKKDRSDLYLEFNRINPIIKIQTGDFIVFGEKTLQRKNSALTKIHVRRMMIEIKKEIRAALRPYVFMPNTGEYLPKINSKVTAILEKFKVGGGLDSYRVVCDGSNNTTVTRQQDIINVSVAVVPNGTIEEVDVVFNINKTDETVTAN